MRDGFVQTDEVVDVRPLRRRRHVFEAQIDCLDQAETAVDDAHGGDTVETVAYDAAVRRRHRRGSEGTDAEFGGVGGPEVDAVAVDAEVVVLGADANFERECFFVGGFELYIPVSTENLNKQHKTTCEGNTVTTFMATITLTTIGFRCLLVLV